MYRVSAGRRTEGGGPKQNNGVHKGSDDVRLHWSQRPQLPRQNSPTVPFLCLASHPTCLFGIRLHRNLFNLLPTSILILNLGSSMQRSSVQYSQLFGQWFLTSLPCLSHFLHFLFVLLLVYFAQPNCFLGILLNLKSLSSRHVFEGELEGSSDGNWEREVELQVGPTHCFRSEKPFSVHPSDGTRGPPIQVQVVSPLEGFFQHWCGFQGFADVGLEISVG